MSIKSVIGTSLIAFVVSAILSYFYYRRKQLRIETSRAARALAHDLAQETCEHGVLLLEKCVDCDLNS